MRFLTADDIEEYPATYQGECGFRSQHERRVWMERCNSCDTCRGTRLVAAKPCPDCRHLQAKPETDAADAAADKSVAA